MCHRPRPATLVARAVTNPEETRMSDSIRVMRRPSRAGPFRYRRLAIAGVIAATAIAVPTAALASRSGTPSGKPAAPQPPAARASNSAAAANKAAAAGNSAAAISDSAAAARKSAAAQSHHTVPAPVRAFATRLGISIDTAGRALKQVAALNDKNGGVDRSSAALTAIAHDLGVSPARLAAAWDAAKQSLTGH
jgi:hypothetical protein